MKTQFGTIVKQLRERKGMDQKELGEVVGVSDKTVSSWEINRTEPKMGIVQQLADYFGVSTDYLIKGNQDDVIYESSNIGYTRVPLYEAICCGNGGFVDENIIDMIPVPSKGLNPRAEYFAQYAKGESMKDAGVAVYVLVPLFPQFDVLSGGAGTGAGADEARRLGEKDRRGSLRGGARPVCALLSGALRPAHSRLVG